MLLTVGDRPAASSPRQRASSDATPAQMDFLTQIAVALILLPVVLVLLAFFGYPLLLLAVGAFRPALREPPDLAEWPEVTVTLPVYNEEGVIRDRIENILGFDYPRDKLHLLVLSDASSDRTDEIASSFADRGVQLVRLPKRSGKGAAENLAYSYLRGSIAVNVDATTVLQPGSLKALIRHFGDPTVGVVSGRDVSIGSLMNESNSGEAGYVGYEMWVRRLETRAGGIVGASGCFFGKRRELYPADFPIRYSRDFAAPLFARERGFRSVSAEKALCAVPRVPSLRREYKRKVRTMHRGLETLVYMRRLLNPFAYGWFALKLVCHKLVRWLVPLSVIGAVAGLALHATLWDNVDWLFYAVLVLGAVGVYAVRAPDGRVLSRPVAFAGYLVLGVAASAEAWYKLLVGNEEDATWEPTRRRA